MPFERGDPPEQTCARRAAGLGATCCQGGIRVVGSQVRSRSSSRSRPVRSAGGAAQADPDPFALEDPRRARARRARPSTGGVRIAANAGPGHCPETSICCRPSSSAPQRPHRRWSGIALLSAARDRGGERLAQARWRGDPRQVCSRPASVAVARAAGRARGGDGAGVARVLLATREIHAAREGEDALEGSSGHWRTRGCRGASRPWRTLDALRRSAKREGGLGRSRCAPTLARLHLLGRSTSGRAVRAGVEPGERWAQLTPDNTQRASNLGRPNST